MRRLITVLALTGVLLTMTAGSAFATIHPLVCSENSAGAADGTAADSQDPPGITPGGPDRSTQFATPLFKIFFGPSGGAAFNAFKAEGC